MSSLQPLCVQITILYINIYIIRVRLISGFQTSFYFRRYNVCVIVAIVINSEGLVYTFTFILHPYVCICVFFFENDVYTSHTVAIQSVIYVYGRYRFLEVFVRSETNPTRVRLQPFLRLNLCFLRGAPSFLRPVPLALVPPRWKAYFRSVCL